MKNVTIRELKAAAKRAAYLVPSVRVSRSAPGGVWWYVGVTSVERYVGVADDSRQGAMRMALAALKAGKK